MKNQLLIMGIMILFLGVVVAIGYFLRVQSEPSPIHPTPTASPSPWPSPSSTPTAQLSSSPLPFPTNVPTPTSTPASTATPIPTPKPVPTDLPQMYTVVRGDTLSSIARKYGLTLAQIIALNPQVTNPNIIVPGQIIYVTGTIAPTPSLPPNEPSKTPLEISKINTNRKQVVFTFDAGSGTQSAQPILDTLRKHSVKGSFFITGKWAEQNPELVKKISQDGHEIFNHTYSHPHLPQISDQAIIDELQKTEAIVQSLTDRTTKPYFRPPYGDRTLHVRDIAAQQGYQSVFWTVDALDWKETEGYTAQQVKDRVLGNLAPGTIYLMHIGDTITGQILDSVLREVKSQGYTVHSLTEGLK